jgi:dsDNA-specific endonuclease/ATPase MutS2
MNNNEHILEFDKIKQQWSALAMTAAAKEKISQTTPYMEEAVLLKLQKETTQARRMIETCGIPPIPSLSQIPDILDAAQKEGCLTPEQLEYVGTSLTSVRRLKDYLNRCKTFQFSLGFYEEDLNSCDDIAESIEIQIRNGQVDDYSSKLLHSIRQKLIIENEKMHNRAEQFLRTHRSFLADSFTTLRNGHLCIPVKKEYRPKIDGSVLDKSSTGNTLFIEPAVISRHYDAIQLLKLDEENEEMRIRYTLTAMILDELETFTNNRRTIEKLDYIFSKGKLSLEYNGCEPTINTERRIILQDARHPLMDKTQCIPLQFKIEPDIRGVIITGPNTGGKTVTLKTVALNCMMAQCGLHVTCRRADICMNSNFLCDIGDGQSLSENLSTFSAHLKNILSILDSVNKESLVVLDELGSGTDPTEGMGIAIAVLEKLKTSHALFLVTTHYPEIKHYAQDEEYIINARMDFDKNNLRPLYQLIIGEAGESCAFSIAKQLGMSDEMLKIATYAAYGDMDIASDRQTMDDITKSKPRSLVKSTEVKSNSKVNVSTSKIQKKKDKTARTKQETARQFHPGDSVMVYPDKKIGIVCQPTNEKGFLQVQMPDGKININHKRIKLHVSASELYPDDYDFSIIFDTVENRKLRHQMSRKYVEDTLQEFPEG